MIWKTSTHEFSATVCQRTGKTCPGLAHLARSIAQAVTTAGPATSPDFRVEGSSELTHCGPGCIARFDARADLIRVFCGARPEADAESLGAYADLMFDDLAGACPAHGLDTSPCAMLQAVALAPAAPVDHPLSAAF
ncbi:conserved hypothetical protein [Ruegeria lacuscaerulensis ITI-1157]|nr:conserved hypothetical protein [Ruegeria lacuscaerulensis ITI-1157]SHJ53489.1 hypothetical protein SAMN05444404_2175 [Ruegeria lacuscaerulensis ITI-1157]